MDGGARNERGSVFEWGGLLTINLKGSLGRKITGTSTEVARFSVVPSKILALKLLGVPWTLRRRRVVRRGCWDTCFSHTPVITYHSWRFSSPERLSSRPCRRSAGREQKMS